MSEDVKALVERYVKEQLKEAIDKAVSNLMTSMPLSPKFYEAAEWFKEKGYDPAASWFRLDEAPDSIALECYISMLRPDVEWDVAYAKEKEQKEEAEVWMVEVGKEREWFKAMVPEGSNRQVRFPGIQPRIRNGMISIMLRQRT